jgi:signal transduction histidine kinase
MWQRVSVCDRGPGIPAEEVKRLFKPFQQLAPACHSNHGIGLGLSIVRSIVEAHGGQIGAGNRRCGGASFWFQLAVVSETPAELTRTGDCMAGMSPTSPAKRRMQIV